MRMDRYAEIWHRLSVATTKLAEDADSQPPMREVALNEGEQILLIAIHDTVWKLIVELGLEVKRRF